MTGDWKVITADCLDPHSGLPGLEERSVDVLIADPPYSEHVHAGQPRKKPLEFAPLAPDTRRLMAGAFARVTRRWVLVFCDAEGLDGWRRDLTAAGLQWIRTGFWERDGGAPQLSGDRPAVGAECIAIAHRKGRMRWNGGGRPALWRHAVVQGEPVRHPAQKPLGLMRDLVRDFSNPGELVCDPTCGAGTTGVAALDLGRRFLGFEVRADWAEVARARIAGIGLLTPKGQLSLLDAATR
jgi:site-specific DNA-methyltransferase (adenine-specific)